ncbi:hypothetical protein J4219_02640 [Candidatus Woesearchaeota archaeon]|nr:hypothetical protein [Candidatus Woesearchaeota archaeon]
MAAKLPKEVYDIKSFESQKQRELKTGKRLELEKELKDLECYLDLVSKGETAETLEHIEFLRKKKEVLKRLL